MSVETPNSQDINLLVFGRTGQVARELARIAPGATFLGRDQADLSNPDGLSAIIQEHRPTAAINAAAWTAVDAAEDAQDEALLVNGAAPGAMAVACADLGIPFVHISTDYVFDGKGDKAFSPADSTAPLGAYGRTKLAGENAVRDAGGVYAILRTSWVFSAHGNNFVKTMLRLSDSRAEVSVVADQTGGPTPAGAIARACLGIARTFASGGGKAGVYHFSGAPDASWAEFAREIFRQADRDVTVQDIATADFPTKAARPANSRLDCATTYTVFGVERPDWRAGLADVLHDLSEA